MDHFECDDLLDHNRYQTEVTEVSKLNIIILPAGSSNYIVKAD